MKKGIKEMSKRELQALLLMYKEKKNLSKREEQVLHLICKEFTPAMIARKLKIHEKTFFTHRARLMTKTNCKTNIGLFRYAICSGLFDDSKLKAKRPGVL